MTLILFEDFNPNSEVVTPDDIIAKLTAITDKVLPKFYVNMTVVKTSSFFNTKSIRVTIQSSENHPSANNNPEKVVVYIEHEATPLTMTVNSLLMRMPIKTNPDEKYLVYKTVGIPFRKPSANWKSIYTAFEKYCIAYKAAVKDIYDNNLLTHPDLMDYSKLF
jgi:hypothetical protein